MLEVRKEGNHLVIDVRPAFHAGLHPKEEILRTVREAANGTVIELHLPHPGTPLIQTLEDMGLQVNVKQLEPNHYCLECTHRNTPSE